MDFPYISIHHFVYYDFGPINIYQINYPFTIHLRRTEVTNIAKYRPCHRHRKNALTSYTYRLIAIIVDTRKILSASSFFFFFASFLLTFSCVLR